MRGLSKLAICALAASVSSAATANLVVNDGTTTTTLPRAEITGYDISVVDGVYVIEIDTVAGWSLEFNDGNPDPDPDPDPDPEPTVFSVSVSASNTAPEVGDVVTFTWNTSNAASCEPIFGNVEWRQSTIAPLDSGSVDITMDEATPDIRFRLRCLDPDGNQLIRGTALVVTAPDGGNDTNPDCPNPQIARQGDSVDTWDELFRNLSGSAQGFPNALDSEVQVNVNPERYKQFSFDTGSFVGAGNLTTVGLNDGIRRMSISECPGVFSEAELGSDCSKEQWTGTTVAQIVYWSTTGSPASNGSQTFPTCQLDPNKTYYLNVTYADFGVEGETVEGTHCQTSFCAHKIRSTTFD